MYKCILIQQTGIVKLLLRRYAVNDEKCPTSGFGYCNVQIPIKETDTVREDGVIGSCDNDKELLEKYKDILVAMKCSCGYQFIDEDHRQIFKDAEYVDEQGNKFALRDAPIGSMWYCTWRQKYFQQYTGEDGRSLVVKLPNGHEWAIDSRASNCDSPCKNCGSPYHMHHTATHPCKDYEDARPHKCWVRHGIPPNIHVDKDGVTCGAGTGSIQCFDYHGFLHNGHLTTNG